MPTTNPIKIKLEQGGFGGLYVPGQCACIKDDIAPCGSCEPDDAGWINGCEPGYRHDDPRPGHKGEWAIGCSKTPMTDEEFNAIGP